jgi:crotonobetainyl-CoA:carnitine CoA-transferase CaiB-like acyl-CoA transferase
LKLNPRLIYCRMTGWGQDGPLAKAAGHDINYIALTGLLSAIGRKGDKPALPLNLVGDYGGGGMLLAFGMVCGLLEAQRSGQGQVVDVAMTDGAALLFGSIAGLHASGYWTDERGTNLLDSGAHFYDVYETKDGKYVSIGSIEPQFYAILLDKLGLAGADLPANIDARSVQAQANLHAIGKIGRGQHLPSPKVDDVAVGERPRRGDQVIAENRGWVALARHIHGVESGGCIRIGRARMRGKPQCDAVALLPE